MVVVGAGIDEDSTAATVGALSEREERLRATFAGKVAGESDSELPLWAEEGGGGLPLSSLEALVEPLEILTKFPSGSKS